MTIFGQTKTVLISDAEKRQREQDIRDRRHRAAFFGDCGMPSCQSCAEARQQEHDVIMLEWYALNGH